MVQYSQEFRESVTPPLIQACAPGEPNFEFPILRVNAPPEMTPTVFFMKYEGPIMFELRFIERNKNIWTTSAKSQQWFQIEIPCNCY